MLDFAVNLTNKPFGSAYSFLSLIYSASIKTPVILLTRVVLEYRKKVIVDFQTKLVVYHSYHLNCDVIVKKFSSDVFNHFYTLAAFTQTKQGVLITVRYIYSTFVFHQY